MKKRILSFLLVFMLAVCALPMSALAVETAPVVTLTASGGTGTDGNFYPGDTVTITVSIETQENAGLYGFEITLPSSDITVAWDETFAAEHGAGEASGAKILWAYDEDIIVGEEETGAAISGDVLTLTYKLPSAYEFGDSTTLEETFEVDFIASGLPIVTEGEYFHTTAYDLDASVTLTVEEKAYVPGDVNDDGEFDILDLNKACMVYLEVDTFDCPDGAWDVCPDGEFDILDLNKMCMVYLEVDSF